MLNYSRLGPEALLQIYNPSKSSQVPHEVKALVNSAAGITCIPKSVIDKLGNLDYSFVRAKGFNSSHTKLKKVLVRLKIVNEAGDTLHDQEIFVLEVPGREYALIGRDILNQYKVVLDGPQKKWRLNCTASCD